MKLSTMLGAAALASVAAAPSYAQRITGTLNFKSLGTTNYFAPANGGVPAGYGNTTSATVAIGSGIEFGYQDIANLDTADFTAKSLTITDVTSGGLGATNFFMTFTSSVSGFFSGAAFTSNGFAGTFAVTGNTLTFTAPLTTANGTRTSVITFAGAGAVPEPATWALMLVGFGAVGYGMRRRQKVSTSVSYAG